MQFTNVLDNISHNLLKTGSLDNIFPEFWLAGLAAMGCPPSYYARQIAPIKSSSCLLYNMKSARYSNTSWLS